MDPLLEFLLLLVLCVVFLRNHLFAAVICVGMLVLRYLDMTVMLFKGAEVLLVILVLLFLGLFVVEKLCKPAKSIAVENLRWILGIVRLPANVIYLGDIVFRLRHWGPVGDIPRDQPSLGAGIGVFLETPLIITLIIAVILLVLYVVQIMGAGRDKGGAEGAISGG